MAHMRPLKDSEVDLITALAVGREVCRDLGWSSALGFQPLTAMPCHCQQLQAQIQHSLGLYWKAQVERFLLHLHQVELRQLQHQQRQHSPDSQSLSFRWIIQRRRQACWDSSHEQQQQQQCPMPHCSQNLRFQPLLRLCCQLQRSHNVQQTRHEQRRPLKWG